MSRQLRFTGFLVAAVALAAGVPAGTAGDKKSNSKVRVVIIDGQNNHNWQATTPVMKKELEDSGRFTVDVATSPDRPKLPEPQKPQPPLEPKPPKDENDEKAQAKYKQALKNYPAALEKYKEAMEKYPAALEKYKEALPKFKEDLKVAQQAFADWRIDFDKYDVMLSNYNGQSWPKEINTQLEQRLRDGKIGLVIVHAANNAFGGWKEYNQMIGMGWRGPSGGDRLFLDEQGNPLKVVEVTAVSSKQQFHVYVDGRGKPVMVAPGPGDGSGHRYSGPFTVTVRDESHPVTKGMPREWMHNSDELYDNMRGPIENVHLLATAYSKGTQKNEPMIWTVSYGKGRVFHTPMGHDVNGMRCVGFMATLQRGTEWAATGAVTLPLPDNFPTDKKISTIK